MNKEEILKDLEPLFERAEKEKLCFQFDILDQPVFLPSELKLHLSRNHFLRGSEFWTLVEPEKKATKLRRIRDTAQTDLGLWQEKIKKEFGQ